MTKYTLDPLNNQAIQAAINGDWATAITLNSELSKKYPEEAEILNRLAKAYVESADLSKAKSAYRSALKVDPYNHIAKKNLEKLSTANESDLHRMSGSAISPNMFLEEPGKTAIAEVTDLAMGKVVSTLKIGDKLRFEVNGNTITLISPLAKRVGKLEETTAQIVTSAVRVGSKFDFIVKSVELNKNSENLKVTVFIRETLHSSKLTSPVFSAALETEKLDNERDEDSHSQLEEGDQVNQEHSDEHVTDTLSEAEESIAEDHTQIEDDYISDEEDHDISKDIPSSEDEEHREFLTEDTSTEEAVNTNTKNLN